MAASNFDAIYNAVLRHEGGLSTRTAATGDPGGRTMQGVTQGTYNNWRASQGLPQQDVARIGADEHRTIFRDLYWNPIRGDELPTGLDYSMLDTAFNAGPSRAIRLLQRSLGMDEDGRIGPDTLTAAAGENPSQLLGQYTANRRAMYQSFNNADQNPGWWPRINDVNAASAAAIKNGGFGNVTIPGPPAGSDGFGAGYSVFNPDGTINGGFGTATGVITTGNPYGFGDGYNTTPQAGAGSIGPGGSAPGGLPNLGYNQPGSGPGDALGTGGPGLNGLGPNAIPTQFLDRPNDYRAIAALYQQDTGRSPDADGANYWLKSLQSGQSLMDVDRGIRASDEAKAYLSMPSTSAGTYNPTTGAGQMQPSDVVNTAFNAVLGRAPDATGSDYFTQQAQNGTSLAGIMDALLKSPEYAQTYGAPGLTPTQGVSGQTPTIGNTGTTPTQGVSSFADLINNAYQATLQRPADAAGTDYWTQALQNGSVSPDAIQQALTQSPEYAQTHPAQQVPTIGPNGTVTATTPNVQAIDPIDVGTYSPLVGPQTANTIGAPAAVTAFDRAQYLQANPDVAAANVDPLTHYLRYGQAENRSLDLAGDKFSDQAYLAANPDVAMSGMNPLAHYLRYGMGEGRAAPIVGPDGTVSNVQNYVNASTYAPSDWASILNTAINTPTQGAPALSPTINNAVDAPIVTNIPQAAHVWSPAETPTLSPTEFAKAWSPEEYLNANQDVRAAGLDPLQHYLQFGINENRAIDTKGDRLPVTFNSQAYLAANPDVAMAGLNPLAHFLTAGADEGRAASWDGNPYSFSSLNAGGFTIPGLNNSAPRPQIPNAGTDIARGATTDAGMETNFLLNQIGQLNQNVWQSKNVENQILMGGGVPMPTFAQNSFLPGAASNVAANQNIYLNQVNNALANSAPVAPAPSSFAVGMAPQQTFGVRVGTAGLPF